MKTLLLLAVFLASITLVVSTNGVDFSGFIAESDTSGDLSCLVQNGQSFTIIQTWMGGYCMTTNIADAVGWAWAAGFAHVDVYIFMCPCCYNNGDAASVVSTVVNSLASQGVTYGMIWFDIEQCSGCWSDVSTNCGYIASAVNEAVALGAHVGLYSSEYEWGVTVGTGCCAFTGYPLWYAHYDGCCNFDDSWAYEFGGWTTPAMKQYADTGPCFSVDSDWYPDSWEGTYKNYTSSSQQPVDRSKYAAQFAAYEEFKQNLINGSVPNPVMGVSPRTRYPKQRIILN